MGVVGNVNLPCRRSRRDASGNIVAWRCPTYQATDNDRDYGCTNGRSARFIRKRELFAQIRLEAFISNVKYV